jgi:integrase
MSQNEFKKKRTILGRIMDFDQKGVSPDSKRTELARSDAYTKLNSEYRQLIDWYMSNCRERGLKESSINTESKNIAPFLLAMQRNEIARLCDATEEAILNLFMTEDGYIIRGQSNRRIIAAFFRTCMELADYDACKKILSFFPKKRAIKKNVQYLTPHEIQAILDAMDDMSNKLSLRDRAIGKTAYYTGLRSCDIAALDIASLDFDRDIITIKQQKTETPLDIPLRAVVGNAIYDYLVGERPQVGCSAVFITTGKPYKRMHSGSMWRVSARIMDEASIRQSKGNRKGLHLFRHNLVTSLLGNGVPQPVISDVVGQNSPRSLEPYLSTDIANLKSCALSIACFPIDEAVFTDA